MELYSGEFGLILYDDKWFEDLGPGTPESELPVSHAVADILPRCEPGLARCFEAFTPLRLELQGHSMSSAPNLFVMSSRGGLIKIPPHADGFAVVDFQGVEWERLARLQVGIFNPTACEAEEPPWYCERGPHAFTVESLSFRPIPEPALVALLGTGVIGLVGRRLGQRQPSPTSP